MCGYYYSNKHLSNIEYLKRRGPEGWQTLDHEHGKFGHAMLNTIGTLTKQPYQTKYGILLYNGSTYNSKGDNDAKWLADNLTDNVSQCVEVVKNLNGEYSITWVTKDFVMFCVDPFAIRPLYYFIDDELHIASLPNTLKNFPTQYKVEGNWIYIYDKNKKTVDRIANVEWNLDQTVNNYDTVFEVFEQAVADRHTPDNMYALGGIDSGTICCSVHKQFGKLNSSVCIPAGENKEALAQRMQLHKTKPVPYDYSKSQFDIKEIDECLNGQNNDTRNEFGIYGISSIILKYMKPEGRKVLVTGSGGDEIYADYGIKGKKIYKHHSVFGGHFPKHLNILWPWHNHFDKLSTYVERHEIVGGNQGIEIRMPMVDKRLVQAWLNTTHSLKNKRYKGWMLDYMDTCDYPYTEEKVGFNLKPTAYKLSSINNSKDRIV